MAEKTEAESFPDSTEVGTMRTLAGRDAAAWGRWMWIPEASVGIQSPFHDTRLPPGNQKHLPVGQVAGKPAELHLLGNWVFGC